jgi:hypothetical protein
MTLKRQETVFEINLSPCRSFRHCIRGLNQWIQTMQTDDANALQVQLFHASLQTKEHCPAALDML